MFFRKINRKEFGIACTYLESPLPNCPAELSGADGSTIFESITVHSISQSAEESSGAGEADCLPPRGKVVELYQRSPPFQPRLDSREKKIIRISRTGISRKNRITQTGTQIRISRSFSKGFMRDRKSVGRERVC